MSAWAYQMDNDQAPDTWEAEIVELIPACTCHVAGPDDMGNYDLLEDDDCPRHGSAT